MNGKSGNIFSKNTFINSWPSASSGAAVLCSKVDNDFVAGPLPSRSLAFCSEAASMATIRSNLASSAATSLARALGVS